MIPGGLQGSAPGNRSKLTNSQEPRPFTGDADAKSQPGRLSVPQKNPHSPEPDQREPRDIKVPYEARQSHDDKNQHSFPGSRDSTNSYYKKVHEAQQNDQKNPNYDYNLEDIPSQSGADQNGAKIDCDGQQNATGKEAVRKSTHEDKAGQEEEQEVDDQRPATEEMREVEDMQVRNFNDVIPEADGEQQEYRTNDPNATQGSQNLGPSLYMPQGGYGGDIVGVDESFDFEDQNEDELLDGPVLLSILSGFIQSRGHA